MIAHVTARQQSQPRSGLKGLRRSVSKFLAVPFLIVVIFLLSAVVIHSLERSDSGWIQHLRDFLGQFLFANGDVTSGFLGTAGSGMITMTSITISMLLLVLQQTASSMGNMVYDQFLTRRRNQIYAGFIVGGTALPLYLRGTVSGDFNPVLGASFTLAVLILALGGLLWFLYMTIDQMRPSTVVSDIYERTGTARAKQLQLIEQTQRGSRSGAPIQAVLHAGGQGYVTDIDLDEVRACLEAESWNVEIISKTKIGSYVSHNEIMAEIKAEHAEEARRVAECLGQAYYLEHRRQLDDDPAYGLKQLEMIAWAEVSTAKDNPETGLMVTRALRDLVSRWVLEPDQEEVEGRRLPLVYEDTILRDALDVLESITVVSSESLQYQNFAEVLDALAVFYQWLPPHLQRRADDLLRRAVSAMGDHVLTRDLEQSLARLSRSLRAAGSEQTAHMLDGARSKLDGSVGKLASRGTRAQGGG